MPQLSFELSGKDTSSAARAGLIRTDHGEIPTPIFMPVGTAGSVKGVTGDQLIQEIHAKIILGNTYHLYLRPGTEVLEKAGGLHRFMNWAAAHTYRQWRIPGFFTGRYQKDYGRGGDV